MNHDAVRSVNFTKINVRLDVERPFVYSCPRIKAETSTMNLTPSDWHERFLQQAGWTAELRRHLFERAGLASARRVLEVGCGTGALLAALGECTQARVYGLDLNPEYLALAAGHASQSRLVRGDAHLLPYPDQAFDLVFCHFLLLWVADPARVVLEMKRVTRHGGAVLVFAEPDYGGRIDYPEELAALGEWQQAALRRQGADPRIGRRLANIFIKAGLADFQLGVLGGQWSEPLNQAAWESEWTIIEADLEQLSSDSGRLQPGNLRRAVLEHSLESLKALDAAAWARRERVLFVPLFYAWAFNGTPTSMTPSTTRTG
jgi:SAM-dependent methyltransferase